jgi:Subtilisin inhibitor-like
MGMRPQKLGARRCTRSRHPVRQCTIAALGALIVAGCGSAAAPTAGGSAGQHAGTTAASKINLHITVTDGTTGPVKRWTLRCDPPGGTHPNPAAACRILLSVKNPFGPSSSVKMMCPMILASARRAVITGTYNGHRVNEQIVDGGCDQLRWGKLKGIFG